MASSAHVDTPDGVCFAVPSRGRGPQRRHPTARCGEGYCPQGPGSDGPTGTKERGPAQPEPALEDDAVTFQSHYVPAHGAAQRTDAPPRRWWVSCQGATRSIYIVQKTVCLCDLGYLYKVGFSDPGSFRYIKNRRR
jgi:hypothetical protein